MNLNVVTFNLSNQIKKTQNKQFVLFFVYFVHMPFIYDSNLSIESYLNLFKYHNFFCKKNRNVA